MSRYGYEGDRVFRPLTPWAYFGYTLLFCIPLVGFILLIVFSLSDQNINRRSFARSFWCGLIIVLIFAGIGIASGGMKEVLQALQGVAQSR